MKVLGPMMCGVLVCAGCIAAPRTPVAQTAPPAITAVAENSNPPSFKAAQRVPVQESTTTGGVDEKALADALSELEAIGEIDPQLKRELIADLRETKPELWGPTIQVYRSALAYREQLAARDAEAEQAAPQALPADETAHPAARVAAQPAVALATDEQASAANQAPAATEPVQLAVAQSPAPAPPASVPVSTPSTSPKSAPPAPTKGESAAAQTPAQVQPTAAVVAVTPEQPAPEPAAAKPAPPALSWQEHLEQAVAKLDAELQEREPHDADALRRQVALRLMHLAAGERDAALRPISGLSPTQQDFWSQQFFGLATYLDHQQITDPADRAAAALEYLTEANAQLGELSTLRVKNLAFCSEVKSYGVYTKFEKYEFAPQQEVLLYAEVENFGSEPTENGFRTTLRSSYQIIDSRGQRVEAQEFPEIEELCINRRRDFFMRYFVYIPKRIYDGTYTLQLTIEDVKNQKFNQASIEFTVQGAK